MKRLLILTALAALSLSANSYTSDSYILPYGAWPFCINGVAQALSIDCSWFKPEAATYMLGIRANSPASTVAYQYKITATIQDGKTVTVFGIIARDDDKFGNTTVAPISFGGIAAFNTMQLEVTELAATNIRRIPLQVADGPRMGVYGK